MEKSEPVAIREIDLPWSDGTLSARLWRYGDKTVVGVPELGLNCYGQSESEAVFRLFSALMKYYRQLKNDEKNLSEKGAAHLNLLSRWVKQVESRMISNSSMPYSISGKKS